jgi:hypothetical protein
MQWEIGLLILNVLLLLYKINHNNQINVHGNVELFTYHESMDIYNESNEHM